ncbi:MAG: polyphenol oxidase family protein [Mariprofundales bacterium]|nr:polyphenol oxidase family protein [Mariprofundales bacterium]
MVSRKHGVTLAIRTADCLPILLADADAGVIAAVHAGWRGTVANVAARAVHVMVEMGAATTAIHADLGPAIADCCFTVDGECRQQLQQTASGIGMVAQGALQSASLSAINRWQLEEAGIDSHHITDQRVCTCCTTNYFSHRRDNSPWRQLALIGV